MKLHKLIDLPQGLGYVLSLRNLRIPAADIVTQHPLFRGIILNSRRLSDFRIFRVYI